MRAFSAPGISSAGALLPRPAAAPFSSRRPHFSRAHGSHRAVPFTLPLSIPPCAGSSGAPPRSSLRRRSRTASRGAPRPHPGPLSAPRLSLPYCPDRLSSSRSSCLRPCGRRPIAGIQAASHPFASRLLTPLVAGRCPRPRPASPSCRRPAAVPSLSAPHALAGPASRPAIAGRAPRGGRPNPIGGLPQLAPLPSLGRFRSVVSVALVGRASVGVPCVLSPGRSGINSRP